MAYSERYEDVPAKESVDEHHFVRHQQHLRQLLPGQDWSTARALCTHARIAAAAAAVGFGQVAQAPPLLDALVAFLQSNP